MIGLNHGYTVNELRKIVEEALEKNKDGQEKTVKIMLSGGISKFVYQTSDPTLIVLIDLLKLKPQEIYENGIKVNSVKYERYIPESKSTNYIEAVRQTQIGRKSGAYEPIFYSDNQVYEGSNSNIFAIKNGKIYTPKSNIYLGITREVLLKDLNYKLNIIERDFSFHFLLGADEVFIASSGKEIVPVVKIDANIISNGQVGKITKGVMNEFKNYVNSDKW